MMMNIQLKLPHYHPPLYYPSPLLSSSICIYPRASLSLSPTTTLSPNVFSLAPTRPRAIRVSFSDIVPSFLDSQEEEQHGEEQGVEKLDDLAPDSPVYKETLRLVECSMFAAVAGLAYLLSNSLAIENYFGCFFALPIVVSSMRWGVAAGRKTMVATAVLLLVLSGPVKALSYVLMYGLLGFTMGSLWRLQVSWGVSLFLCTLVRAFGALGYVVTSSFLIQENILALITVNLHAIITLIFNSCGFNTVPSMTTIYIIFSVVLLLNCGFFVFLLHILYALFLSRLGLKRSLRLPRWLEKAL